MGNLVTYTPTSAITKALFNFDDIAGFPSRIWSGPVRVSTSDSFTLSDYFSYRFSGLLYSDPPWNGEATWSADRLAGIHLVLDTYKKFANIDLQWVGDFEFVGTDTTATPRDVGMGNASDINISSVWRTSNIDRRLTGLSGGTFTDNYLGYVGSVGDVFLYFEHGSFSSIGNISEYSNGSQTLFHEFGHSLGLSHPFAANGITSDFSKTVGLGFEKLGFHINSAADMNREYFTLMSYDDQYQFMGFWSFNAYTPMILDVIALSTAYGEGSGTSGSGNDVIEAGTVGYRTYFDTGGTDTISLAIYTSGAYLNMGTAIVGANHLVGIAMSAYDAANTVISGGNPQHLRWFYGEFEAATGSGYADVILGNRLDNLIVGYGGDDVLWGYDGNDLISGNDGNDSIDGGSGTDSAIYRGDFSKARIDVRPSDRALIVTSEGVDVLTKVEYLVFADGIKHAVADFLVGLPIEGTSY
jgi:hypothetical protein